MVGPVGPVGPVGRHLQVRQHFEFRHRPCEKTSFGRRGDLPQNPLNPVGARPRARILPPQCSLGTAQKAWCCKTHSKPLSVKNDTTVVTSKVAALMAPWPWRWLKMV